MIMRPVTPYLDAFKERLIAIKENPLTLRLAICIPIGLVGTLIILISVYRLINPPVSTLTLARYITLRPVHQTWMPLSKISKHLPRAVIMSEDARYCTHNGVDWSAVEAALEDLEEGEKPRGASTIPMQTAKNLFLWHSRSYIRKVFEVPLAYTISLMWPKRRVIEVYLNIAEWGPGIFGAEAAAKYHFKKSAANLTAHEASLLAAALPNPFIRRAGRPGPKTRRHAGRILKRMKGAGPWVRCLTK